MPDEQTIDDELDEITFNSQKTRACIRVKAVILTRLGWPGERVADALGCSLRSVRQWLTDWPHSVVATLAE